MWRGVSISPPAISISSSVSSSSAHYGAVEASRQLLTHLVHEGHDLIRGEAVLQAAIKSGVAGVKVGLLLRGPQHNGHVIASFTHQARGGLVQVEHEGLRDDGDGNVHPLGLPYMAGVGLRSVPSIIRVTG